MNKVLAILIGCTVLFSCRKVDENTSTPEAKDTDDLLELTRDAGGSSGGVDFECKGCAIRYPDSSNLPRSLAAFNESDVLVASEPGIATCGTQPQQIKVWYADEHPLCLGVKQVIVKTAAGSTPYSFPISPSTTSGPAALDNPLIGDTAQQGDLSANDPGVGGGRPLFPALYVTDISTDLKARDGDWQQGGRAFLPNHVYGMWKAVTRIVDKTKNPALVTIQVDADPPKTNGWNLAGGKLPPSGTLSDKYGALITWDISALGMQPGHVYRVQFMVHDGDQNKVGGDVGQSCTTIIIPY